MPAPQDFSQAGEDFLQRLIHPTRGIRYGKKTGVRTASEVGLRKVKYFRGCDFIDHLEELTQGAVYSDTRLETLAVRWLGSHMSIEDVGMRLLKEGLISVALYKPLTEKIKKFPDRLIRTRGGPRKIDREGYYIVNVQERDKYLAVKIIALITGILSVVMFPAWPFWAKVGLWYSIVLLLFAFIGFILLRIVVYLFFWVIGLEVWVMPALFDDYVPWSEAFTPILLVSKNDDDLATVGVRFFFLASMALAMSEISRTWALEDLASPAFTSMEWGHDKLWERYHLESTRAALPSLEELDDIADT